MYNINIIKQSSCLAVNPITFDPFAYLFHCTSGLGFRLYDGPRFKNY